MSTHSVSGLWNSMTCASLGEKERMPRMESFSMLVMAAAFRSESLAHGHFPPPRSSGASSALLHSGRPTRRLARRCVHERCGRKGGNAHGAPTVRKRKLRPSRSASRPTESNATKAAVLRCTARQAPQLAAVLGWLVLISATFGLVWRESIRRCVVAIVALTFVTRTSCHAATASAQGAFAPSQGASARRARCPSLRTI